MFLVLKISFLFGQRIELIFSDTRKIRHWPFSLQKGQIRKDRILAFGLCLGFLSQKKRPFH